MRKKVTVDKSQLPYLAFELGELYQKAGNLGHYSGVSTTCIYIPGWLYNEICRVWKEIKTIDPQWRYEQ